MVIFSQNVVILRNEKVNTDLENSRLKAANLESANLLLKQQIHPHFLFNALSMLKSLYKSDLKAGEAYLSHLVNFLRASLAEPQSRVARLFDEIRLCNEYLEMQKIRFEDALICNIDIPGSILLEGFIPSFSIQSLIENAIKHNEVTESSPLSIRVFYKDERIITENNLQIRNQIEAQSGKGLINLIERYRILSGDEVIIHQDEKTFSVSIKVLSNEGSNH
jgi:LytS/YehU family sensor histidine kinase